MPHLRGLVVRALTMIMIIAGGSMAVAVPTEAAPRFTTSPPRTMPPHHPQWLDGFLLGWVPPGIGSLVTDFESEWEEVRFRSRVWETRFPDDTYRVDLQVTIMRHPTFTDRESVRAFLIDYLERDPDGWATEAFDHPDGTGFADSDELFWLARPGVAVRVSADHEVVAPADLERTACAVRAMAPR